MEMWQKPLHFSNTLWKQLSCCLAQLSLVMLGERTKKLCVILWGCLFTCSAWMVG